MFTPEEVTAFLTVIGIDLVLSGDNAIVIGTAAAGLPAEQRKRAITIGIAIAAITRMLFAMVAFYLLQIIGLLLAGGLLLAWVAWIMWREARREANATAAAEANGDKPAGDKDITVKSFRSALTAIVIADVSMSLDNVLAVTGAAKDHLMILIFGLALSIALMGVAANFIARIMDRYKWIVYVGIALIIYVAADMIWRGSVQVSDELGGLSGIMDWLNGLVKSS
ncbi:MAG: YjbE family putative metal transport protein [Alphaproteobacteria bacterium]|nr:YjbE family putative metal transport protein [Alphaproteobacteria bacterium]